MRRHRFLVPFDVVTNTLSITDTSTLHQMRDVLNLALGEEVVLGDGRGNEFVGSIQKIGQREIVIAKVSGGVEPKKTLPGRKVIACVSLLKRDNFEWVVQKATEVGVSEIVPLISGRTVKTGFQRMRLEKIIKEAAEQSGKLCVPKLSEPLLLAKALELPGDKIFFDMCAHKVSKKDVASDSVIIFIGPEGGWDDRERALAEKHSCAIRSLGDTTLRAETAAVIGAYLAVVF